MEMANLKEKLSDMTHCSVCMGMFSDPRILPCIHTFCLRCLEQAAKASAKGPGNELPCPFCKTKFFIPKEGLTGIKKNFFMDNLMELMEVAKPEGNQTCAFCSEDIGEELAEIPKATVYCSDCREFICDECSRQHKKQKPSRNHQIVPVGMELVDLSRKRVSLDSCSQHRDEQLKMYCMACKTLVCVVCFAESHKLHECNDIHRVAGDFRIQIEQEIQQLSYLLPESKNRILGLEKARNEVIRQVEATEKDIRNRAEEVRNLVEKHLKTALEDLSERKGKMLKRIEIDLGDSENHLAITESFQTYCKEVLSKASPGDVCHCADDLHTRANDLRQIHGGKIRIPVPAFKTSFKKMNLEDALKLKNLNLLGYVEDNFTSVQSTETQNIQANQVSKTNNDGFDMKTSTPLQPKKTRVLSRQIDEVHNQQVKSQLMMQGVQLAEVEFPKYWGMGYEQQRRFQFNKGSQLFNDISRLINNSFLCGNQRGGFKQNYYNTVPQILNIWHIENRVLFNQYATKKKAFSLNFSVNKCQMLQQVLGTDIKTFQPGLTTLNDALSSQMNERYLLCPAAETMVERICQNGFQVNDMPNAEGCHIGSMIRFVEAIQYPDFMNVCQPSRPIFGGRNLVPSVRPSGQFVYVARVLLGNPYVSRSPTEFQRTPCMRSNCNSDKCYDHETWGAFDSVIEIEDVGRKARLKSTGVYSEESRNFIIYDPDQSYPDFLVEYK